MLTEETLPFLVHEVLFLVMRESFEGLFCLFPRCELLFALKSFFCFSSGRGYLIFDSGSVVPIGGTGGCLDGLGHRGQKKPDRVLDAFPTLHSELIADLSK